MPRHLLSGIVFLALLAAPPALAQYMYLDSNGDGVHTAADVLHGTGPTQVTIWLNTNHRRDGTEAACLQEPATPIDLMADFAVVIRATAGTFSCTDPVSLQPLLTNPYAITPGPTEYHIGYFGLAFLGTGLFPLARFTAVVVSGTPSVDIVARATTLGSFPFITAFGSGCLGRDYDDTLKLGSDWFDADGLAFEAGGTVNSAPLIPPLSPFASSVGQFESRDVAITDPDGDLVQASILSPPPFLFYSNLMKSAGSTLTRLYVQPRRDDVGAFDVTLAASDGNKQSTQPFHVDVSGGANHLPVATPVPRVDVVAGMVAQKLLWGSDSDGDPVTFSKLSGPAYVDVLSLGSGHGGSSGRLTLQPTLCDIGDAQVVIGINDGTGSTTMSVPLRVHAPQTVPKTTVWTAITGDLLADSAPGDFNEDSHQDVVVADERLGTMTLLTGDGTGALTVAHVYTLGGSRVCIAAADWNHDGHLDVAVGSYLGGSLVVLYGHGDGTFSEPVEIPGIDQSIRLTAADLNLDGIPDLIVTAIADVNTVLLGSDSGLVPTRLLQGLYDRSGIAVGDFDRDGLPDVATSGPFPGAVTLLSGRGDGTFTNRRDLPSANLLVGLAVGDWNGDGRVDLVAVDDSKTVYRLLGDGAGSFTIEPIYQFSGYPLGDVQTIDWNADGSDDLFVTGPGIPGNVIFLGHPDGSFAPAPFTSNLSYRGIRFADFNEDGLPDLVECGGNRVIVVLNSTTAPTGVLARAFTTDAKEIPIVSSSRTLCVRLEPVGSTFQAADVNGTTLRIASDGTGSVSSVPATTDKSGIVSDTDKNGVAEVSVCFVMKDLALLFDALHGKQSVNTRLEGSLVDGRRFCAPVALSIIAGGGGTLAAHVEPNPLNSTGLLKFSIERRGPVSVRLFDIQGRLVKTLWQARVTEPGIQSVAIDGRTATGQPLSTGIYFYRIETDGRNWTGRFTVLK